MSGPIIDNSNGVDVFRLATIDLERLVAGNADEKQQLYEAARYPGAFLLDLKNCQDGVLDSVKELYALSDTYFGQDRETKLKDERKDQLPSQDRGYKFAPCDETFEMADDELLRGNIQLPSMIGEKKAMIKAFNESCHAAAMTMLSSLDEALRQDPTATPPSSEPLETYHDVADASDSGLKLIKEPWMARAADVVENKHTDSGTFTILFYEEPGLHVYLPREERWAFAPQTGPTCALVSVANTLQRLSGGAFHSPLHRVTQPADGARERFYLSYFLRPGVKA